MSRDRFQVVSSYISFTTQVELVNWFGNQLKGFYYEIFKTRLLTALLLSAVKHFFVLSFNSLTLIILYDHY